MSLIVTAGCRLRQAGIRVLRRGRRPEQSAEEGAGSVFSTAQILRSNRLKKPMIVLGADAAPWRERILRNMEESNIEYALWEDLPELPTEEDGEGIALAWIQNICDCFVVLGDWHSIDIVKAAAARTANNSRTILQMAGRGRLRKRHLPPMVAVPTVAGSGAESLAWASVFDDRGNMFLLSDISLTPDFVVMDPELTVNADRGVLAQSIVNGLCLATEAYLSGFSSDTVRRMAGEAVKGILTYGEACWNSGGTPAEQIGLLRASRLAGLAASAGGCGYVRALCRAAVRVNGGAFGNICAGMLPLVLENYGSQASERLGDLAEMCAVDPRLSRTEKAEQLIGRYRQLTFRIGLPDLAEAVTAESCEEIADLAAAEANPTYACPVVWTAGDLYGVLRKIHYD